MGSIGRLFNAAPQGSLGRLLGGVIVIIIVVIVVVVIIIIGRRAHGCCREQGRVPRG